MNSSDQTPMTAEQTATESRPPRDTRLSFRASSRQAALFRDAAEATEKSVTDFVLESAAAAAERVLAERRWFRIDKESWDAFQATLDRPVVFKPRLNALLGSQDGFVD
jgi:uncharacterized protein (DUF1778 family)